MESKKEFSFFHEKANDVNETINRTPIKKLAFVAIAIGISFGAAFSVSGKVYDGVGNWWQNHMFKSGAEAKLMAKDLAKITPEDMKNFSQYLKNNANIYDLQLTLVTNALTKAEIENPPVTSSASKGNKVLSNAVAEYKKQLEQIISNSNKTYLIIKQQPELADSDDIKQFFTYYSNYQAGIYTRDTSIENKFNDWMYNTQDYNKQYNEKNGVNEAYKKLNDELSQSKFKP